MTKGRVEALTDGVAAIIITIMVLEFKVPHGGSLDGLRPLVPTFLSYVLSFAFVGIYWNNHHHFFQAAKHVNGGVLWANLHLLFWLSLIPFATSWMGETGFAQIPVAIYGVLLLLCAIAFGVMTHTIVKANGEDSEFATRLGTDWKGKISPFIYLAGIGLTWLHPALGWLCYGIVACLWLIPDRRFEPNGNPTKN